MRALGWLCWTCLPVLWAGCSLGGWSDGTGPALNNLNPYVSALSQANAEGVPLTFETTQVLNDGQQLHVFGIVTAHTPWDASKVVLRLVGLQGGRVCREAVRLLSDSLLSRETSGTPLALPAPEAGPRQLKAEEKEAFYVTISVGQISDYQLELLWGDEAEPYLARVNSKQVKLLDLRNVRVEPEESHCQTAGCGAKFRVSLELFNAGDSPINRVVLGVGFLWNNGAAVLDQSRTIPENEEEIEISALKLAAGQARQMRLIFEKPIPQAQAGRLKPTVRVIEAS